jgi:hypothetical protein
MDIPKWYETEQGKKNLIKIINDMCIFHKDGRIEAKSYDVREHREKGGKWDD